MTMLKKPLILLALLALISCGGSDDDDGNPSGGGGADDELTSLPADTGGEHIRVEKGTTDSDFGYFVYEPSGYKDNDKSYPLLIFLHGKGERGNGTTDLDKVLVNGPPNLIKNKKWVGKSPYPMIVASPQYHPTDGKGNDNNWGEGNPAELKGFIEHMIDNYRVNPKRIYITGLSHGGTGVFDYIILEPEATSKVAAAVPIAAWGPDPKYKTVCKNTPIWCFCGGTDGNIATNGGNLGHSVTFITNYNAQSPAPKYDARMTIYPSKGHEGYVWNQTYDLTNVNATTDAAYDPYDKNIYEWMLQYKRSD